jgi:hypothetical protein
MKLAKRAAGLGEENTDYLVTLLASKELASTQTRKPANPFAKSSLLLSSST